MSSQHLLNKPVAGRQLNFSHPLTRGLVLCMLFNEGTGLRAFDLSPYKNHGKLVNFNDPTSKDRSSLGLRFDGVNDYINCGNDPSLDITDAITIEAWVKTSVDSMPIVQQMHIGYSYGVYTLRPNFFAMYIGGIAHPANWYQLFFPSVADGTWHYVVGTRSGTSMKVFVDGIFVDEMVCDSGSIYPSISPLLIGRTKFTGGINYFNGTIDGVKIYKRALSSNEILQLYQSPYCMFK